MLHGTNRRVSCQERGRLKNRLACAGFVTSSIFLRGVVSFWKRNWGDPSGKYLDLDEQKVVPAAAEKGKEVVGAQPTKVTDRAARNEFSVLEERDVLTQRFGKLRSALGEGTVINGKLSFDAPVRIDGRLKGEVYSSKALIVGETGEIDADISVQSLIVLGTVKGNIKASERVELSSGARFDGQLQTSVLVVAEGAAFNGQCQVNSANKVVNVVVDGDRLNDSAAQVKQSLDRQRQDESPGIESGKSENASINPSKNR